MIVVSIDRVYLSTNHKENSLYHDAQPLANAFQFGLRSVSPLVAPPGNNGYYNTVAEFHIEMNYLVQGPMSITHEGLQIGRIKSSAGARVVGLFSNAVFWTLDLSIRNMFPTRINEASRTHE